MGIVKPYYKIILPKTEGDFGLQWIECYNELSDLLHDTEYKPFRINIFLDTIDETDYHCKSNLIRNDLYILGNENKLPIGIIPQSPELSYHIAIEIGMIREKDGLVQYHSHEGLNYCTITSNELIEYWMIGVLSNGKSLNILESSDCSFQKLKSLLDHENLNFKSIVRQWNYVGEILNLDYNTQHYQMFNEVRNTFYSQYRNCPGFPAATGIGMNYKNVGIDCYAIPKNQVLEIIPISNPKQQDSYHYGQEVLVGASIKPKQPPQFERAILLNSNNSSRLIISGTASIIGQNTIGIGDIELQTKVTIENIDILASRSNLERQCPNLAEYPDKYSYLRVYVKNRNDISIVKTICANHYGNVPMNFVQADICRDNLLVEIEAEKVH
jgi:hypothetical protein